MKSPLRLALLATLASSALMATPIVAQAQSAAVAAGPVHQATAIQAGTYAVEPSHTIIGFGISHMGFSTYYGRLSGATGAVTIDPANATLSTVSVSVPVASISTTSPQLDSELRDASWFDAARYPTATFVSTAVTPVGANDADVTGMLTLHGVARPVTLRAHFVGAGINPLNNKYTLGFDLSGTIRRGDFGIKKYLPLIGDDVVLTIGAAFQRG